MKTKTVTTNEHKLTTAESGVIPLRLTVTLTTKEKKKQEFEKVSVGHRLAHCICTQYKFVSYKYYRQLHISMH